MQVTWGFLLRICDECLKREDLFIAGYKLEQQYDLPAQLFAHLPHHCYEAWYYRGTITVRAKACMLLFWHARLAHAIVSENWYKRGKLQEGIAACSLSCHGCAGDRIREGLGAAAAQCCGLLSRVMSSLECCAQVTLYQRAQIDAVVQQEYDVPTLTYLKAQQQERAEQERAEAKEERKEAAESHKRL